jgi:hypothetical protein
MGLCREDSLMPRYSFSEVANLSWADEAGARINCTVTFTDHPTLSGPQPFTAALSDPGWGHSEEIFQRAVAGEFGPIAAYVAPAPAVPESVTPAQAKIVLFEAGLLDDVEQMIKSHQYRPVRIWWENAVQFDRGNPYLEAMGLEIGLTDEQMDAMFIAAAQK